MDNDAVDEIPVIGASEKKEILDAIENKITYSTIDTSVEI